MDCANELYIYVGSAETQEERKRVQFLLDTFLPIGVRTREFDTLKSKKVPQSLEIGLFFCQIFIFII